MNYIIKKIIKSISNSYNNHPDLYNHLIDWVTAGISITSIYNWHDKKKSKYLKRAKAKVEEFNEIDKAMKHADKLSLNQKYLNEIATSFILKTSDFSSQHVKYPKEILNNLNHKHIKKSANLRAHKQPIKELVRWCKTLHFNKLDKQYLQEHIGESYIILINNHWKTLKRLNTHKSIKICYRIYEDMKKYSERR